MIRASIAAVLLLVLFAAPAGAAATERHSLTISVTDSVEEARPGDTLNYVATVANRGGEAFEGVVTITTPAFATLEAAEDDGEVSWPVSLSPGESKDFRATAIVGKGSAADYQVVTVASMATADAASEILVRAADADRIPGTEAPAEVPGLVEPAGKSFLPRVIGAIAVVVLLGAAVAAAIVFRRRGRRPVAPPTDRQLPVETQERNSG